MPPVARLVAMYREVDGALAGDRERGPLRQGWSGRAALEG